MLRPSPPRIICGFIAGIILLLIAAWLSGSTGQICESNQSTNQNDCASYSLPIYVLINGVTFLNFYGVLITAIATGVIAWLTVTLAGVGKQQADDARIVQRAYINVVSPYSELRFDQAGTLVALRVWVVWKNAGRTPAFPMFARIGATFVGQVQQFRWGKPPATVVDPMALGPSAEFSSGHIDISAIHVTAAAAGNGNQFVWGEARYRDTFPDTPEHVVEFCYRVESEGQLIPTPGACRVRFNLHGEHNRYYDQSQQNNENSGDVGGQPQPMTDSETNRRQQTEGQTGSKQLISQDGMIQGLLCAFTFGLVVVGLLQNGTLDSQRRVLEKTDQTLRIQQRAWLAPKGINYPPDFFMQPKPPYKPAVIDFNFMNTGKEPAQFVSRAISYKFLDNAWNVAQINQRMSEILDNKTCDGISTDTNGSTVFPGDGEHMLFSLDEKDTQVVLGGGHYLMIGGCLVYRTISETHWSEVCRFLDPIDPALFPGQRGFHTGICPVRNRTDQN
jgi:hypothetical protein